MSVRFKWWRWAALLAAVGLAAVAFLLWRRANQHYDAAKLIQLLPQDRSVHVFLDVGALRSTGLLDLLAGSKAAEEPEYRKFVQDSGFDYRTDLDAAAAAFHSGSTYLAVRGRFHWDRLETYARGQGGRCENQMCSMPASQAGRYISFYPLKGDVLALAVSTEERGVRLIGPQTWSKPPQIAAVPVWISTPPYVYGEMQGLPSGSRAFLSPLAQAQGVVFSLSRPAGSATAYEMRMDADCGTTEVAADLEHRLSATTDLLRKMLVRQNMTPNPADLSGVLVSGRFAQQQARVTGAWTIDGKFVQSLVAGKIE